MAKKLNNIRILGLNYEVRYGDIYETLGDSAAGLVLPADGKIFVDGSNKACDHSSSVLLHEIIEVLNYRLELGLPHNVITELETGMFAVLRDNAGLAKQIAG